MSTKTAPKQTVQFTDDHARRPAKWSRILVVALAAVVAGIVGIVLALMSVSNDPPIPLGNGDFESGDLADWTLRSSPASSQFWGGWYAYDDGQTPPYDGPRRYSFNAFDVVDPPQGQYAAVSDGNAAGLYVLYQDFRVDRPSTLHMTVFYETFIPPGFGWGESRIIAPNNFRVGSHPEAPANQQYRIDLIDPEASIYSLDEDDLLGTVFRTAEGDPISMEPTEATFDLSPLVNRTVRLRIVLVSNRGPFFAGLDNVRIEPNS